MEMLPGQREGANIDERAIIPGARWQLPLPIRTPLPDSEEKQKPPPAADEADFASRIEVCENTAGIAEALQRIVNAGLPSDCA